MSETSVSNQNLKTHVEYLAGSLGERNYIEHKNLESAANYIKKKLQNYGYQPEEQVYYFENIPYRNISAVKQGISRKDSAIIICAHYDSVWGSPGADDNASGVAGLLELARLLSKDAIRKTIWFIAFANEEPPFFMSNDMGSFRYAQEARKKNEGIEGVLCLESIGFYSDKKNSQGYPAIFNLFFPNTANFIGVTSNLSSWQLLKRVVRKFKEVSDFPMESLVAPQLLVPAVGFSDNWSFWKFGYKAVMITDTAFYRNPYYHTEQDTPDKIDYQKLTSLVEGLYKVILKLAE